MGSGLTGLQGVVDCNLLLRFQSWECQPEWTGLELANDINILTYTTANFKLAISESDEESGNNLPFFSIPFSSEIQYLEAYYMSEKVR